MVSGCDIMDVMMTMMVLISLEFERWVWLKYPERKMNDLPGELWGKREANNHVGKRCLGDIIFLFPYGHCHLLAELIERRGIDVTKSVSSPEIFIGLEAHHTYFLTLEPCFITGPLLFFVFLELRPNAKWVSMKSSKHYQWVWKTRQNQSNLWCLQVQAQFLSWP